MSTYAELASALDLLTESLDDPAVDLATEVDVLGDVVEDAVPSYLGLTITAATVPVPVTLTVPPSPWRSAAEASLHMTFPPLEAPSPKAVQTAITLFAANAGAFVDLAADLAYTLSTPLADVAVDQHLPRSRSDDDGFDHVRAGAITVGELSVVNQAIGVLIDRGDEPHDAPTTLTRHAAFTGKTLAAAAALIVASATL